VSAPSDHLEPRLILERHLAVRGTTCWAWAEAERLDSGIVHALALGEHPCAAPQLCAIGTALGCDSTAWAQALAAGICRCPVAALAESLRGRLWSWLIARGLTLEEGATACGVPRRALALAARSGRISGRLRASRLPAFLGLAHGHPLLDPGPRGCPALRALIADGRSRHPHSVQALAERLGVAARTVRLLLRGALPPVFNPEVVPRLARCLGLDHERLVVALARAWQLRQTVQPAHPSPPTLASLLMRHCLAQAISARRFAATLGCSAGQVRSWLRGRLPRAHSRERLRVALGVAPEPWTQACRAQAALCYATRDEPDQAGEPPAPPAPSLAQLITRRAAAQGLDSMRWALAAGISGVVLGRVLRQGQAPRREEVRATLMRALGVDRLAYDRAVARLLAERRSALPLAPSGPRTALQEHLIGRLRAGSTSIGQLARDSGVGRSTIERVVRHGGADLRLAVREKLRAYLGLESSAFQRQVQPLGDERCDDDEEMQLLRCFRLAAPAARAALLAQAVRPDPAAHGASATVATDAARHG